MQSVARFVAAHSIQHYGGNLFTFYEQLEDNRILYLIFISLKSKVTHKLLRIN